MQPSRTERRRHRAGNAHPRTPARTSLVLAAALVAAVAATFANAIPNGFVFDDHLTIVHDPAVRAPVADLPRHLDYRPLRTLSYRLDYALAGMQPWIFHLGNVAYHGVTVLLVFAVVRACGASVQAAAVGALVFAVHPVQAESVTYASGRRDVLCGLFFVAGFLAYLRARARPRIVPAALAAAAFAAALLVKEMAVTLPLVCLLHHRWRARPGAPGRLGRGVVLLTVAALVVAGGYWWPHIMARWSAVPWYGGSAGAHLATVVRVWTHYLTLLVWPLQLSADYSYAGFPPSARALDPRALTGLAVLAALGWAAWRRWRAGGLAGLGAAWWAVTLLPVSHVVPHHELMAEHYLYVPMVGVALALAGGWDALAVRLPARRRRLAAAAALTVVALLAVRTAVRNRDWRDDLTLWTATVAVTPGSARAHLSLGHAHLRRGRIAAARAAFERALALRADHGPTHVALAMLLARQGDHSGAAAHADAALKILGDRGQLLMLAGAIALERGRPEEARRRFEEAARRYRASDAPDAAARARIAAARAAEAADAAGSSGR